MTDRSYQNKQLRVNLIGIATFVLALLSLVLAIATSNLDIKLMHVGMTLMFICISAGIIHFRTRTPAERPPAVLTPFFVMLLMGFALGTIFVGASLPGRVGLLIEVVPTVLIVAVGIWCAVMANKAKRDSLDVQPH